MTDVATWAENELARPPDGASGGSEDSAMAYHVAW